MLDLCICPAVCSTLFLLQHLALLQELFSSHSKFLMLEFMFLCLCLGPPLEKIIFMFEIHAPLVPQLQYLRPIYGLAACTESSSTVLPFCRSAVVSSQ